MLKPLTLIVSISIIPLVAIKSQELSEEFFRKNNATITEPRPIPKFVEQEYFRGLGAIPGYYSPLYRRCIVLNTGEKLFYGPNLSEPPHGPTTLFY